MSVEVEAQNVVLVEEGNLPPPVTLDGATGLPIDDNEVVAEVTDAAVEIAEIEAGKEIAIAQIKADTAIAIEHEITERVETSRTVDEEREYQWQLMQENMAALSEQVQTLGSSLAHLLTPPPSEPEPEAVEVTETLSIPQSISDVTNSTPMEAIGESVSESLAEPIIAPKRPRRRAI